MGSAIALLLAQQGWRVRLIEKRPLPEARPGKDNTQVRPRTAAAQCPLSLCLTPLCCLCRPTCWSCRLGAPLCASRPASTCVPLLPLPMARRVSLGILFATSMLSCCTILTCASCSCLLLQRDWQGGALRQVDHGPRGPTHGRLVRSGSQPEGPALSQGYELPRCWCHNMDMQVVLWVHG